MITTDEDVINQNTSDRSAQQASQPSARPLATKPSLTATPSLASRPRRIIPHHPKAGLNPISDAAAPLFSMCGQLKKLKSYRHLSKLHQELMQEIQAFQTMAKTQGYSSEHILVSRYALCATLDDLIKNTSWGAHGQWDQYSLLTAFHPDTVNPDRFFVILERIIKEPSLYIDILELMYICLSLGFEGPYRSGSATPEPTQVDHYNNFQFEKIIQGLYQQIRAYRGDFHKNLSPYLLRPLPSRRKNHKTTSLGWTLLLTSCFVLIIMSGLGYSLGTMITQIDQDLKQIGKTSFYETH